MHAVKFVKGSDDLIEGLAIPFGSLGRKDLDGEFFTKDTDLCLDWFEQRPLLYHHGLHDTVKATVVGRVKSHEIRDDGLWVQAEIDKNSKYRQHVQKLIAAESVGFSSGAMSHLVDTAPSGEIKRWPWVEESLTPTPASPDALQVYAVKSTDLIEHLAAIESPIPSELIAGALKALDATKNDSENEPFAEHGQRVLADLAGFVGRSRERLVARGKAGRPSRANREFLASYIEQLDEIAAKSDEIRQLLTDTDPDAGAAALAGAAEFERFQASQAGVPV